MKISVYFHLLVMGLIAGAAGCSPDNSATATDTRTVFVEQLPEYETHPLPEGLVWETNDTDPVFASPNARKGGTFRTFMLDFPLTMRVVGPDSNTGLREVSLANQLSLTDIHPDTQNIIPSLATHWAYDADGRTVYYKLNPGARWSDSRLVLADDFIFALEFMRSQHIVAPWYNRHYTEEILEVKKYDDYTLSITGARPRPKVDLHFYYGMSPRPRHFHKLDENWVTDYNWRIEPNTGPYQFSEIRKGKYVELQLKPDWWARDLRYYQNRFNAEKIRMTVIRDMELAYRHFLKGELDSFPLTLPAYWHDKARGTEYDKGYIHRIWYYNDVPQPASGMYLNEANPYLKDVNVRYALAHAMNFDKVIDVVLRGDYQRLHNVDTGYGDYTNPDIRAREFDLDKADEYLSKAGWVQRGPDGIRIKDGRRLSFTVSYGQDIHTDRLVVLKEEAKKAGIDLLLERLDPATAYKKVIEKKHDIAWMAWGSQFRPQYWSQFHSENANKPQTNNITNTADPAMDALIERFDNSIDERERQALARELQQKIHDSGVVIPATMVPYVRMAYWRWLKLPDKPGTRWTEDLFEFGGSAGGLFWIDEEVKAETLSARREGKAFEPVTTVDTRYKKAD
jgi:microcin C transport system substrate-binding protein